MNRVFSSVRTNGTAVRALALLAVASLAIALWGCSEPLTTYEVSGTKLTGRERILVLPFLDTRTFVDKKDQYADDLGPHARDIFVAAMRGNLIAARATILTPDAPEAAEHSLTLAQAAEIGRRHGADVVVAGQIFSFTGTRAASIPPRAGMFVRVVSARDGSLLFVGDHYMAASLPGAAGGREQQARNVSNRLLESMVDRVRPLVAAAMQSVASAHAYASPIVRETVAADQNGDEPPPFVFDTPLPAPPPPELSAMPDLPSIDFGDDLFLLPPPAPEAKSDVVPPELAEARASAAPAKTADPHPVPLPDLDTPLPPSVADVPIGPGGLELADIPEPLPAPPELMEELAAFEAEASDPYAAPAVAEQPAQALAMDEEIFKAVERYDETLEELAPPPIDSLAEAAVADEPIRIEEIPGGVAGEVADASIRVVQMEDDAAEDAAELPDAPELAEAELAQDIGELDDAGPVASPLAELFGAAEPAGMTLAPVETVEMAEAAETVEAVAAPVETLSPLAAIVAAAPASLPSGDELAADLFADEEPVLNETASATSIVPQIVAAPVVVAAPLVGQPTEITDLTLRAAPAEGSMSQSDYIDRMMAEMYGPEATSALPAMVPEAPRVVEVATSAIVNPHPAAPGPTAYEITARETLEPFELAGSAAVEPASPLAAVFAAASGQTTMAAPAAVAESAVPAAQAIDLIPAAAFDALPTTESSAARGNTITIRNAAAPVSSVQGYVAAPRGSSVAVEQPRPVRMREMVELPVDPRSAEVGPRPMTFAPVLSPTRPNAVRVLMLPYHDRDNPNNLIPVTGGGEVVTSIIGSQLALDADVRILWDSTGKVTHYRLVDKDEAIAMGRAAGADYVVRGQVVEFRRAQSVPSVYSAVISTAVLAAQVFLAEMSGVDLATEVYRVSDGECVVSRRDRAQQKYVVQAEKTVRRIAEGMAPGILATVKNPNAGPMDPLIEEIEPLTILTN